MEATIFALFIIGAWSMILTYTIIYHSPEMATKRPFRIIMLITFLLLTATALLLNYPKKKK